MRLLVRIDPHPVDDGEQTAVRIVALSEPVETTPAVDLVHVATNEPAAATYACRAPQAVTPSCNVGSLQFSGMGTWMFTPPE